MTILHFVNGHLPVPIENLDQMPAAGMIWLDVMREDAEAANWPARVQALLGVGVDSEHVQDSFSPRHPSFFDGTPDYDLLVFSGLGPDVQPLHLDLRQTTFLLFERLVVTIRSVDSGCFDAIHQRVKAGRFRCSPTPVSLAHAIMDVMVDRFLLVREEMDAHYTRLQDELLDENSATSDWRELLTGRRVARRLETVAVNQGDALDSWRRGTRFRWTGGESVRVRDLSGHVDRVQSYASNIEHDIESAVQLHFASVAHRTNQVMQSLTVLSAVFFPLTLIVGIYGMNFENMPELHWHLGYYLTLGLLLLISVVLLGWFRWRRWL